MKVIVSQYGSRRRYMIPQILEAHGYLKALYTDSTSDSLFGMIAYFIQRFKKSQALSRLVRRQTGIDSRKVFANDKLQLKLLINRLLKRPHIYDAETIFEGNSKAFIKKGVKDTDCLYTMFIENYDFTLYAKRNEVKIIADIYENPYIWEELEKEITKDAYRSIRHLKSLYTAQSQLRKKYVDKLLETADKYLVPSDYVNDCLKRSKNYSIEKVHIIPYASSVKNKTFCNNPIKGRIIWIGNDVVRKGLCYCAQISSILKEMNYDIDFRIIGPVPSDLLNDPYYKDLNFIGYCNKEQLENEFKVADLFVFPTLAEGFAGVLLEAASFGVPILTTYASGFNKNAPCTFFNVCNIRGAVDDIVNLLDNRDLRDELSRQIFDYSQTLDSSSFEKGLINLLDNI